MGRNLRFLTAESVEGAALALQGVDDVHGGDSLPLGMLGVGDGVADDVLKEDLENSAGLLVDEAGDALDSSTTGQTTNGGLGDTLDVVPQDLAMPLGTALAKTFAPFAATSHDEVEKVVERVPESEREINSKRIDDANQCCQFF